MGSFYPPQNPFGQETPQIFLSKQDSLASPGARTQADLHRIMLQQSDGDYILQCIPSYTITSDATQDYEENLYTPTNLRSAKFDNPAPLTRASENVSTQDPYKRPSTMPSGTQFQGRRLPSIGSPGSASIYADAKHLAGNDSGVGSIRSSQNGDHSNHESLHHGHHEHRSPSQNGHVSHHDHKSQHGHVSHHEHRSHNGHHSQHGPTESHSHHGHVSHHDHKSQHGHVSHHEHRSHHGHHENKSHHSRPTESHSQHGHVSHHEHHGHREHESHHSHVSHHEHHSHHMPTESHSHHGHVSHHEHHGNREHESHHGNHESKSHHRPTESHSHHGHVSHHEHHGHHEEHSHHMPTELQSPGPFHLDALDGVPTRGQTISWNPELRNSQIQTISPESPNRFSRKSQSPVPKSFSHGYATEIPSPLSRKPSQLHDHSRGSQFMMASDLVPSTHKAEAQEFVYHPQSPSRHPVYQTDSTDVIPRSKAPMTSVQPMSPHNGRMVSAQPMSPHSHPLETMHHPLETMQFSPHHPLETVQSSQTIREAHRENSLPPRPVYEKLEPVPQTSMMRSYSNAPNRVNHYILMDQPTVTTVYHHYPKKKLVKHCYHDRE